MKNYYLFLMLYLICATSFAQTDNLKKESFFSRNRNDEITFVLLNSRIGGKLFSPVYDNISYYFERDLINTPFSGSVMLPENNYMHNFEISPVQVVLKNNIVMDLNIAYSWRGKLREPGRINSTVVSMGMGYQIRLNSSLRLRSMVYAGYGESRQRIVRWREDDTAMDLEIRQGQMQIKPEISLIKILGKEQGLSLSCNVGYDIGLFKTQSVRLTEDELERKRTFEEFNLQHNTQSINSVGFNPNRLVFSLGLGFYINSN